MIPVNSVLQVGFFPEIMQIEVDRRLQPVFMPDPNGVAPKNDVQAILTRPSYPISPALLDQLPQVKMIACCGVGYDNLPLAYLKQKGSKTYDTIMEGVTSIHYYPSMYDLSIMAKLANINIVLIGRKTEKNPDGFEVLYYGSTYFMIWLYAYDRFKVIDRFSLIANVKNKQVLFTQGDLPTSFIEKIKDKLVIHNVDVDDT